MQGVAFSTVPYDFAENEYVVEPQASSPTAAALRTGTGILDPPFPPKRPPGPISAAPTNLLWRIAAALSRRARGHDVVPHVCRSL